MKKILAVCVAVIILAGAAVVGSSVYKKYSPVKETMDAAAFFETEEDTAAIILDNEILKTKALFAEDQIYLPLDFVKDKLNDRFYWSETEKLLIYTLPLSVVSADTSSTGSSGAHLVICRGEETYIQAELAAAYTDMYYEKYTDGAARIFIDLPHEKDTVAKAARKEGVRVLGGIKSEVLTWLTGGDEVQVLETMEKWSRVRTGDGFIGYVRNASLKDAADRETIKDFEEPDYTGRKLSQPVCLAWHQVTALTANSAIKDLAAEAPGMNVIAPTWFMLTDDEGNFSSYASAEYVETAHSLGIEVWPVLDNFNMGDNVHSEILFASSESRAKLIEGLLEEAEKTGFDGINLDIEGIKAEAGPHYTQFIRELSVSCRKNGLTLSVDDYVPASCRTIYNFAEQGVMADYVIIMGYDEHYAGGEPGSVASLPYEVSAVEDALSMVPADSLVLALPLYTRLWKTGTDGVTSTAMGVEAAEKWVADNGLSLEWLDEEGQYYTQKEEDDGVSLLWLEEEESLALKASVIIQNKLAGVAVWKLGLGTDETWQIIENTAQALKSR